MEATTTAAAAAASRTDSDERLQLTAHVVDKELRVLVALTQKVVWEPKLSRYRRDAQTLLVETQSNLFKWLRAMERRQGLDRKDGWTVFARCICETKKAAFLDELESAIESINRFTLRLKLKTGIRARNKWQLDKAERAFFDLHLIAGIKLLCLDIEKALDLYRDTVFQVATRVGPQDFPGFHQVVMMYNQHRTSGTWDHFVGTVNPFLLAQVPASTDTAAKASTNATEKASTDATAEAMIPTARHDSDREGLLQKPSRVSLYRRLVGGLRHKSGEQDDGN